MMSTAPDAPPTDLLEECQAVLEYRFQNPDFLRAALTHASGAHSRLTSNERLEFLGDAVLGLVVCEQLFAKFPGLDEGQMTRIKSAVVSSRTCAAMSQALGLDRFLRVDKTLKAGISTNVLADVVEAVIAAVYLDGGFEAARGFVLRHLADRISLVADSSHGEDYKSSLQRRWQRECGREPSYLLLDEKGPGHSKCWQVAVVLGETQYPSAWGRTKKEAEQKAARNTLLVLNGEPPVDAGE